MLGSMRVLRDEVASLQFKVEIVGASGCLAHDVRAHWVCIPEVRPKTDVCVKSYDGDEVCLGLLMMLLSMMMLNSFLKFLKVKLIWMSYMR
jgi:hypothetical protein